jgi:hypothetical protein
MKEERRPPLTFQFKEGYYAFCRGWLRNQYDEESIKGKEWQRGWNKAYFDNLDNLKRKAA